MRICVNIHLYCLSLINFYPSLNRPERQKQRLYLWPKQIQPMDTAQYTLVQHPDYRHLVGFIDAGNYNWLDFSISDEGKLDLFVRGARAAAQFLQKLDWEARIKCYAASCRK